MTLKRAPITLVLFDAFDTLVTPRIPPHMQYAEESRKAGLEISDETMKVAFKSAFKEMSQKHPIYGLNTGLESSNQWWIELISKSLELAGISNKKVTSIMPNLGVKLFDRFSTIQAYKLAEGVPTIFHLLLNLKKEAKEEKKRKLNWNLATNSDTRILSVFESLGLNSSFHLNVQLKGQSGTEDYQSTQVESRNSINDHQDDNGDSLSSEPSLSYFLGYEKPHATFFHKAVQRSFSDDPSSTSSLSDLCAQTLYVGDDFREDYLGAKQAGLQAVWLQRSQPWSNELSKSDKEKVVAVKSMQDVANIIRESWSS